MKMSVKTVGKEKVGVLDIPGFYVGLTDDVKVQLQKLENRTSAAWLSICAATAAGR